MSSGTIGDPERCTKALKMLVNITTISGISVAEYHVFNKAAEFVSEIPIEPRFIGGFISQYARGSSYALVGFNTFMTGGHIVVLGYPILPHRLIQRVWQDCDGGGWLKKHLDAMKVKITAGLDKVGGKLFPDVKPAPNPIPATTKMIQAGVVAVAATAAAAISAALYMVGLRNVPMMEAPAGFGITTNPSPFSSDQNQIL